MMLRICGFALALAICMAGCSKQQATSPSGSKVDGLPEQLQAPPDAEKSSRLVARIGNYREIGIIAFSPNDRLLTSVDIDKIIFWDLPTGREIVNLGDLGYLCYCIAFSPDGKILAAGGRNSSNVGLIKLYDVQSGRTLKTLTGHKQDVEALNFSQDGKMLFSGAEDQTVKQWDVNTGKLIISRQIESEGQIVISKSGKLAASTFWDGRIKVWDIQTGKLLQSLPSGAMLPSLPLFSRDDKYIITGGSLQAVRFWDIKTGQETLSLGSGQMAGYSFEISNDNQTLAVGTSEGNILLWDVWGNKEERVLGEHKKHVGKIAFSNDDKLLASSSEDGRIIIRELPSGRLIGNFVRQAYSLTSLSVSANSNYIAAGNEGGLIALWDITAGKPIHSFRANEYHNETLAFSPDNKSFAYNGDKQSIIIRNVASGKQSQNLTKDQGTVFAVRFSPDGKLLASGTYDGTVTLWNPATGKEVRSFVNPERWPLSRASLSTPPYFTADAADSAIVFCSATNEVLPKVQQCSMPWRVKNMARDVAFSPNGQFLAIAYSQTPPEVWDVTSGKKLYALKKQVDHVDFSPDGKVLATTQDDGIALWEAKTGDQLRKIAGKYHGISSVTFSPDGSNIVGGLQNNKIGMWETKTGKQVGALSGHAGVVREIAFLQRGKYLVSIADDASMRIWNMQTLKEHAVLYNLNEGKEWLVIDPEGNYDGSPKAASLLSWQRGNRLYPLSKQELRALRKPGLLTEILKK